MITPDHLSNIMSPPLHRVI